MNYPLRNWYVVQTFVNREKETLRRIERLDVEGLTTLLPLRKLCIKRRGEFLWEYKPLYAGYFFINKKLAPADIVRITRLNRVIRILRSRKNPVMVPEKEMKLIFSLIDENKRIGESRAFLVNDRVKIIAGPLKNMEGAITAVDKRRKRITVRLPFFNTDRNVQFSFELVDRLEEQA